MIGFIRPRPAIFQLRQQHFPSRQIRIFVFAIGDEHFTDAMGLLLCGRDVIHQPNDAGFGGILHFYVLWNHMSVHTMNLLSRFCVLHHHIHQFQELCLGRTNIDKRRVNSHHPHIPSDVVQAFVIGKGHLEQTA